MADLSKLSEEEFEELCTGCGECCLVPIMQGCSFACPRLNLKTLHCRVYDKRENELCHKLTPENIPELTWPNGPIPLDCSYVRYMNDEKPYKLPLDEIERKVVVPFKKLPLAQRQRYWKARGRKINPRFSTD